MAYNAAGSTELPLTLFGGLVSEMSPSDVPEGVSWDCPDVWFTPGTVQTRPGLQRVFVSALSGSLVYGKTYVGPTGLIRNLYLTDDGLLWVEDPVNAPGGATQLLQSTPGSFAKSSTAFGREYIAVSDGFHGTDIPMQYDGTNLDRVTQDGPGAPPTIANFILPSFDMIPNGGLSPFTISIITPVNPSGGYNTAIAVDVVGGTAGILVGDQVVIAGNANADFNGVWTISSVFPGTFFVSVYFPLSEPTGAGGTATVAGSITMNRADGTVTVYGNVPGSGNNLKPGYQVQITGVPAAVVGGAISSVKIANEDLPGIATVTMTDPHGLVPGLQVTLDGIASASVGGAIVTAARAGGVTTIKTTTAHGLTPGSSVTISGVTDVSFNTTTLVLQVASDTSFTYAQATSDASSSGGSVALNWPVPQTTTPRYFQVEATPDALSFQVAVNYANGTWSGGTVTYGWDGSFFIKTATTTSFTYQQYGPNAATSAVGKVTPHGQATPGQHQMQVLFQTRQGYITRPSPPVTFIANGGQYLNVTNIPTGPSNVTARILAFTGANGAYFFYIPTDAQINGQTVATATQINDNTTTAVLLDFADNTLYASLGINLPGNNPAAQIVIDGALGFKQYGSRLITYGQRNTIQNFLNLGFDGGVLLSQPSIPAGWISTTPSGTIGSDGRWGDCWRITVTPSAQCGLIAQSAHVDAYGAPIVTPNTKYKLRCWAKASTPVSDVLLTVSISSTLTGFISKAQINAITMTTTGGWHEIDFDTAMPTTIPTDMTLSVFAISSVNTINVTVDEISIGYADNPYVTAAYGSYINNPEAIDGVSGKFGPAQDSRQILDFATIRGNLYMLTQEPAGRIHETSDNGTTEPAGWTINEIASNCGLLSAFALSTSQADDATGAGGEEWFSWASLSGARIFGGDQPWKISQEIQPDWDNINSAARKTVWCLNDPVARVMYFGLPTGTATQPDKVYTMSYRGLDTPYQIALAGPIINSGSKSFSTDRARKWSPWNMPMNNASLMYRSASVFEWVGMGRGFGQAYALNPAFLSDQDYGQINAYYCTYFFAGDAEMQLQLGAHRKMLAYLMAYVYGTGAIRITPMVDRAGNAWSIVCNRTLSPTPPNFDLEWAGGSVTGQRIAFKLQAIPATGTDANFVINRMVAVLRSNARLPVRGSSR